MKRLFLFLVMAFGLMVINSCQKADHDEVDEIEIADADFAGSLTPFSFEIAEDNSEGNVGFLQTARMFFLDMSSENAEKYVEIIQEAIKEDIPIEVYIFPNTTNIAGVKRASKETIERYKKTFGEELPAEAGFRGRCRAADGGLVVFGRGEYLIFIDRKQVQLFSEAKKSCIKSIFVIYLQHKCFL